MVDNENNRMASGKHTNNRILKPLNTILSLKARAHNPEVVGLSSASAAIKTTVFTMKTVVFLTFWCKMESVKMGLELVLELVAENTKIEN